MGDPVVLDAPLDWPDCCALCSNGGGDDTTTATAATCQAWSFDPSTGSCQLMSAVQSTSRNDSWAVNSTVHGYPGYFEAPITDCWGRTQYDLCVNTNVALIIPGVIVAFFSLLYVCVAFESMSLRYGVMKKVLNNPQSAQLVKASCVHVRMYISSKGSHRTLPSCSSFCLTNSVGDRLYRKLCPTELNRTLRRRFLVVDGSQALTFTFAKSTCCPNYAATLRSHMPCAAMCLLRLQLNITADHFRRSRARRSSSTLGRAEPQPPTFTREPLLHAMGPCTLVLHPPCARAVELARRRCSKCSFRRV